MKKNKKVSIVDPIKDEAKGAINHWCLLSLSKTWTSKIWATKKAVPEPKAILIEMKSAKSVENKTVKLIPMKNPK